MEKNWHKLLQLDADAAIFKHRLEGIKITTFSLNKLVLNDL